jgi:uncharacterized SAM-binding protein YcdF (DUF218 family)
MYFVLKALVRSLLLPPASPLIVAVLGALLLRRWRRTGAALLALGLASLWLFATPVVADVLQRLAEHYPALDFDRATRAQAIVILGGGGRRDYAPEYRDSAPDHALLERLSYGAFLARHTGLPILVSGAPLEARAMQTSLSRDFGVPARWVENQSRDTFENARFTAQMLGKQGIRRILLVTSSMHLWRAAHEFDDAGFEVIPAPQGVWVPRDLGPLRFIPGPTGLERSNAVIYELIGEPMRRLQKMLGVRERFDAKAVGAPER